jgi:hypothetical protein
MLAGTARAISYQSRAYSAIPRKSIKMAVLSLKEVRKTFVNTWLYERSASLFLLNRQTHTLIYGRPTR